MILGAGDFCLGVLNRFRVVIAIIMNLTQSEDIDRSLIFLILLNDFDY